LLQQLQLLCYGEKWQYFCQQVDVNVALDNCTGSDDAMAAEEVTGIGSVRNTFEEGLYGDNDSRVQGRPTWAIIKMSLLLQKHPLWCSIFGTS